MATWTGGFANFAQPMVFGAHDIWHLQSNVTTDGGAAITALYRTGFYDLGLTTKERTIRESIMEGTGTVTFKSSRDWGSLDTGTAVTLGTDSTPHQGRVRLAVRGRRFSHQFSGSGVF